MKVYELIQELAQFDANTIVNFKVRAGFHTNVIAKFNRDDEDDKQEVEVFIEFNDEVEYDEIIPSTRYHSDEVTINLEY